jgi:pyroglutamyl-peptidase
MVILVTGFQPYGGRGVNPAHDAMRALDGKSIGGRQVVGRSLPVSFVSLKAYIEAVRDEVKPAAVISIGLWPGEPLIRIERIGINIADFEIADNDGTVLRDGQVVGKAADAKLATLPVRQIEEDMLAAGIPARLSATAGTFLCNACLYTFLETIERKRLGIPCGFIHVPYTPEQVAGVLADVRAGKKLEQHQRADLSSMDLSCTVRAVEIAVAATARALA